ncbi:MAG: DUF4178 domain-containing protein [Planctomycetota bacterium]
MQCPSCGSGIEADERYGHFRVCPYCQSALLLDKEAAKISGKMAVLAKPKGPLHLGATGNAKGRGFQVIGRVRYGYQQGFWDEWYLVFEDGDSGWIGEDEDEFTVEVPVDWQPSPELHESLKPGDALPYPDGDFSLKEKGVAICEGGEGQLPFAVETGEKTPFLDAVGRDENQFLSVEFGEEGPRAFLGQQLERDELHVDTASWTENRFRTEAAEGTRHRVFQEADRSEAISCDCCGGNLGIPDPGATELTCEYCGSEVDLGLERITCKTCTHPITLHQAETAETTICPNCRTQMDLSGDRTAVLAQLTDKDRPNIPFKLGQRFKFENNEWRIAGLIRYTQTDEGVDYHWIDFLMVCPERGYAWLGLENGHFVWAAEMKNHPRINPRMGKRKAAVEHAGMKFKMFERGSARVTWVDGELPWIAQLEDSIGFYDAINPPFSLSAEWTEDEIEWFQGRYLDHATVAKAFDVAEKSLPKAYGVGASQPYINGDFSKAAVKIMSLLLVVSLVLIIWSSIAGGGSATEFSLSHDQFSKPWLSQPFELGGPELCTLKIEGAGLKDAWSYFDIALVNDADEVTHEFSTQISYYSGVEGGESWSEGSRSDSTPFVVEKAGTYRLLVQGQAGHGENADIIRPGSYSTTFSVKKRVVLTRYFIILAVLALIWIACYWIPKLSFEAKRWSDE